jgi:phosphoserine phosphatase
VRNARELNRKIRLVVFDLDGTLTPVDSLWRYLHEELGTWGQGKIAAQKYRRGEISYREWAETDAKCWAGVPLSRITSTLERIPYREGVREVFRSLHENGFKIAIISAGLSVFVDKVAKELGADVALSNVLEEDDGCLTGRINVRVSVDEKRILVEQIASRLGIELSQVALIGDRTFDLSPSECFKIAYKPKDDAARREANVVVEDNDLSRILHYLV